MAKKTKTASPADAQTYAHDQKAVQRPDVGLQQEFLKEKRPPKAYRYDSSLDPALSWDENPGREQAEWLLSLLQRCVDEGEEVVFAQPQTTVDGRFRVTSLKACVTLLQTLSKPFLNWAGKAERAEIKVPTLPLFVHERHSTKAIIDGLQSHKAKGTTLDLFGDPQLDLTDKLRAYEHKGPWVNRLVLGDSLVVMNSLLEYEGLGGQVQMIYMDPPYGVKFGSNFQPFVRKRDVKHADDDQMTREPEMVKAYRDTWELGLHSYLTYLRDRLLLARELLTESGSVFVQISDENLHHIRSVMDEVFGPQNCLGVIAFKKTGYQASGLLPANYDFICWYGKNAENAKYRQLYVPKMETSAFVGQDLWFEFPDGARRRLTKDEKDDSAIWPAGARLFRHKPPEGAGSGGNTDPFEFDGRIFRPKQGKHWSTTPEGMKRLADANRLIAMGNTLRFVNFLDDLAVGPITTVWPDTVVSGFSDPQLYVVQTSTKAVQRCMLMATDPGDLVLDPTCGSGTTAYVAEQWGRRWITTDTSRVPLALARQRLLTATFPYYDLQDPKVGPRGGFRYEHKQNRKGEEVGGLVPHITLKSIANDEPPAMEVLVDRPEILKNVTRVAGPFAVEALMPAAIEVEQPPAPAADDAPVLTAQQELGAYNDGGNHIDRMVRVLKLSRTLRLPENRTLAFDNVRSLDGYDYLHAEAEEQNGSDKRVAIVFGPEDGAIGSETVWAAASEASDAKFAKLYFFGFAIQAKAREMLEDRSKKILPCAFITVTPDVLMSDLLKTTRASEIFSVTGLPDIDVVKAGKDKNTGTDLVQVKLKGLDIFNPATLETEEYAAENLPCWMLDTDYDGMCFIASQVFFPKTSAWDNLQKSLKAQFEPGVWEHLAGTESEPFELGMRRRIAVKVIDERGNELMAVREVKAEGKK
ncbi:site-specific DNA-methyltransferase [Parasulfuritortus cantonensis]|uniref:site-specific DNA-methyltransferase (adenine-specific) n=1 Tax=Parasulfuritortus cantonensis TaxID=2528202 RepID=A0A4R1BG02_9PROT|nr:site-specific DNA-methyltransferase [Parasulfuritortus cantonensis]TCJ16093.1 site-specific DNA-methyltransferase [Parasulfuritortus cantonensis]